jgi:hypothetical protein
MKSLNFVVWTALAVFTAVVAVPSQAAEPAKKPAAAKPEVKKHKKVEGTKVPEKSAKK